MCVTIIMTSKEHGPREGSSMCMLWKLGVSATLPLVVDGRTVSSTESVSPHFVERVPVCRSLTFSTLSLGLGHKG